MQVLERLMLERPEDHLIWRGKIAQVLSIQTLRRIAQTIWTQRCCWLVSSGKWRPKCAKYNAAVVSTVRLMAPMQTRRPLLLAESSIVQVEFAFGKIVVNRQETVSEVAAALLFGWTRFCLPDLLALLFLVCSLMIIFQIFLLTFIEVGGFFGQVEVALASASNAGATKRWLLFDLREIVAVEPVGCLRI